MRKNLKWPNGITIDFSNSRLYWVDGYSLYNHIESCDLNGRKRKVVVSPVPHGFSITYVSTYISIKVLVLWLKDTKASVRVEELVLILK